MSTLTIRNIETEIKDKLRLAAAANGRSMEEEVRTILRSVLSQLDAACAQPSCAGQGGRAI